MGNIEDERIGSIGPGLILGIANRIKQSIIHHGRPDVNAFSCGENRCGPCRPWRGLILRP